MNDLYCPGCGHPQKVHMLSVDGSGLCMHDGNDPCDCTRSWRDVAADPSLGTVYISGPLAGSPELSRDEKMARFGRAVKIMERAGYEVLNPLDVDAGCGQDDCGSINGHTWQCWLRYDLIAMLQECDAIIMLPGWETSGGATLELHIAKNLGWPILRFTQDELTEIVEGA